VSNRTGRFGRANRILASREFREASRYGRRATADRFVLLAKSVAGRDLASSRLGVTVSRKVGNAVVRNAVKRRIREWFRVSRWMFCAPLDVVVIAREAAGGLAGADVARDLDALTRRLGVQR